MPIHLGKDSKGNFVQWGHRTKYYYTSGNKASLNKAKAKAKKQMGAIFANGYIGQQIENNINHISLQKIIDFSQQNKQLILKGLNVAAAASHDTPWTMHILNNKLKASPEMNWVFIKNNQKVIGLFSYCITSNIFNFNNYAIFPKFQGIGFGDQSFKSILQYWKINFPTTIFQFGVVCDNIRAINLYMKNGAFIKDKFKIKDVDFYSMQIENKQIKQSKFDKKFTNKFNILYEQIISNNIYYHISPYKFNKFNLKNFGSGMSTSFWGYGIYFTKNESIIDYYYDIMKNNYKNLFKYTVKIIGNIKNEFDLFNTEKTIGQVYYNLVEQFGEKEASLKMLNQFHIDGIEYYTEEDGNSLVVYNEKSIEILNIQELKDEKI